MLINQVIRLVEARDPTVASKLEADFRAFKNKVGRGSCVKSDVNMFLWSTLEKNGLLDEASDLALSTTSVSNKQWLEVFEANALSKVIQAYR